ATAPLVGLTPTHRVTVDVQRFESVPGKEALVEAVWSVRKDKGGASTSGRTVAREATTDPGFDALAAAHSRALAKVSTDIAAGIRGLRGPPRPPWALLPTPAAREHVQLPAIVDEEQRPERQGAEQEDDHRGEREVDRGHVVEVPRHEDRTDPPHSEDQ